MGTNFWRRYACIAIATLALVGCSGKNAPDTEMTTSPTGLWIGKADSGTSVDIQQGGQLKITRGDREIPGTWVETGPGRLRVTVEGQDYEVPFQRRDLTLKLTLPGDAQASEFEQM
jgi:hypothetical protein